MPVPRCQPEPHSKRARGVHLLRAGAGDRVPTSVYSLRPSPSQTEDRRSALHTLALAAAFRALDGVDGGGNACAAVPPGAGRPVARAEKWWGFRLHTSDIRPGANFLCCERSPLWKKFARPYLFYFYFLFFLVWECFRLDSGCILMWLLVFERTLQNCCRMGLFT